MNKNRALLLDRDGVINADHGYVGTVSRFEFMPDLFPFLRAAQDRGYRLAILTNQSGVARGRFTEEKHALVTNHMLSELRREQITIELTLACFAHPEGAIERYAYESFWRKPHPGMVLEAIRRLDIDPARSVFLGDSERDMLAAQAGGIGKCLWLTAEKAVVPIGITAVADFDAALMHL